VRGNSNSHSEDPPASPPGRFLLENHFVLRVSGRAFIQFNSVTSSHVTQFEAAKPLCPLSEYGMEIVDFYLFRPKPIHFQSCVDGSSRGGA
jgi:hypothetical protein